MGMPKKAVFATAVDINIGDKVRVVRATYGASGADNQVGVIVDGDYNDIHGCTEEDRVLVKLLSGTVWNVGPYARFEIIERYTKSSEPKVIKEELPKIKIYKFPYSSDPEVVTMRPNDNKECGLFGAEGGLAENVNIAGIFVEENGDVKLYIY